MEKKQIQMLVLAGAGLVLLVLLIMPTGKAPVSDGGTVSSVSTGTSVAQTFTDFDSFVKLVADKEINDSLERVMQEKLQESWDRNPFTIMVSTEVEQEPANGEPKVSDREPTFTVSGIVFEQGVEGSSVIINGEFYKVGDVIEGWSIEDIQAECVIFTKDDIRFMYNLYK